MDHPPLHKPGDVYCSNCGYVLTGLTDASRCPECGRPLVEVLTRTPFRRLNRRIRFSSHATLFGLPVISVALGADPERGEPRGRAKGIIAIGDLAVGGVAIGNRAAGIVAIGGASAGVCAIGGASFGVLSSLGGSAVGGLAVGGAAVGIIAVGGGAAGVVAQGGGAAGIYVRAAGAAGAYLVTPTVADPEAVRVFDTLSPVLGAGMPKGARSLAQPAFFSAGITALLALCVVLAAILKLRSARGDSGDGIRETGRAPR